MDVILSVYLKFHGDADWTNVSTLVLTEGRKKNEYAFGTDHKYRADSFSCRLKYNETIANKFLSAEGNILCKVLAGVTTIITGIIPPTYSQDIHEIVDGIDIEVTDNSYLLDRDIEDTYSYTDFFVFNRSDTANSIIHQRLFACGLTEEDISTEYDINTVIPFFCREAGEETEFDTINDLLFENRFTFDFTGDGKFTIRPWTFASPTASYIFDKTNIARTSVSIRKNARSYDSALVKWATLDYQKDALVYRENLPIDSEGNFTGKLLLSGGRFPVDGAIKETWQEFRDKWLSTADNSEDVSIIKVDDAYIDKTVDSGIIIETEIKEIKRARVVFLNSAASSKRIYRFDIRGDVLYRAVINETYSDLVFGIHKKPLTYDSKNIFSSDIADALAISLKNDLKYGDKEYEWKSLDSVEKGSVVQLIQEDPFISTLVIITSKKYTYGKPFYSYTAIGVTSHTSEPVITRGRSASANNQIPGDYFESRYQRSATKPETPAGNAPAGWTIAPPEGTEILWMSTVKKNAAGDVLTAWSDPVRLTGETGATGDPGTPGEDAPYAEILVTSQVFRAKPGELYSPATIILSVAAYNFSATAWQWQYWSGSAWADITGAAAAAHTVYPGDFTDSRTYRCIINGSINSGSATISKFLSGLKNELDLSTWIAGGTIPPTGWILHGLAAENSFVAGYDHDGFSTVLWRCQSDGGVDADGGFTVDFMADPTKTYRFIVYARKATDDGTTSFGCHPAYTENLDGSAAYDPLFWTGSLPDNRDCIIIGIVHPAGYAGGDLEIAGLYDATTGEKLAAGAEFRMTSGASVQQMRVFLDECSASGIIQDLWAPRVEEINGKEDSISAIFKRFAFDLSAQSAFINSLVGTEAFLDALSARIIRSLAKCSDGITPRTEIDLNNALIQARSLDNLSDIILEKASLLFRTRIDVDCPWEEQTWIKKRDGSSLYDFSTSGYGYGRSGLFSNLGKLWAKKENPFTTGYIINDVECNGNTWVAVGYAESTCVGAISRSIDNGKTWGSLLTHSFTKCIFGIAFGNDVWVAVGGLTYTPQIARSTDGGASWSSLITNSFTFVVICVAFGNGVFIAGSSGGKISRSTDNGVTWGSLITITGFSGNNINKLCYADGVWIAVGDKGKIARSINNGLTWTSIVSPFNSNGYIYGLAPGNGIFIAVGTGGEIGRSIDNGETWEIMSSPVTSALNTVAYHDGTWVAGGVSGVLLRSCDNGITWVTGDDIYQPFGSSCFFASIKPGDGQFISVGHSEYGNIALSKWQEAGSGIVECGENSNGKYIRFSDGTLICYGMRLNTANPTHQGSTTAPYAHAIYLSSKNITMPYEFKNAAWICLAIARIGASNFRGLAGTVVVSTTTVSVWEQWNYLYETGRFIDFFAIGEYK